MLWTVRLKKEKHTLNTVDNSDQMSAVLAIDESMGDGRKT
jgi:hypothetical protein